MKEKGWKAIEANQHKITNEKRLEELRAKLQRIRNGERDLYF